MRAPEQRGCLEERRLRRMREAVDTVDAQLMQVRPRPTRLREDIGELSSGRAKLVGVLEQWGNEPLAEEERAAQGRHPSCP